MRLKDFLYNSVFANYMHINFFLNISILHYFFSFVNHRYGVFYEKHEVAMFCDTRSSQLFSIPNRIIPVGSELIDQMTEFFQRIIDKVNHLHRVSQIIEVFVFIETFKIIIVASAPINQIEAGSNHHIGEGFLFGIGKRRHGAFFS